ncbi:DUF4407 domain-containing protein [Pseudobacter ginsenosidimutans]|uniref:Uncharacterized protein DUF4407 n=1 Tax=Pseudobacter ginsenosidimutans TaxID=661488 RepID=A0A4Q7N4L0_9BACT|nr:DUF4407 domain-containing protein [Pseudobacter ginsenosidimutans]QEC44473.1 DUF4407 domain-containing protein [Pseudobacter ginsenosidimutans]RZS75945.1 uncharacterized protein DUF4407 [Pseudobacter ginsenosidimutans]
MQIETSEFPVIKSKEAKPRAKAITLSYWKQFFLYLSGTDLRTIRQCSPDLATRYAILGGLLCIPAMVAFFSSSYAFSILFENSGYSWIAGIFWALIILMIDRSIIAQNPEIEGDPVTVGTENLSKGAGRRTRTFYAGRIIISIVLGCVMAEPLCIRIFDDEIKEQLAKSKKEQFADQKRPLELAIAAIDTAIAKEKEKWDNNEDAAVAEANGSSGSPRGTREVWRAIKDRANEQKTFFEDFRKKKSAEQDSLVQLITKLKNDINANKAVGLTGQMNALHDLSSKELNLLISIWALRILLFCIELIPLLLKSSLKRKSDSYVVLCHQNNKKTIGLNQNDKHSLAVKNMLKARMEEDLRINNMLRKRSMTNIAEDLGFYLTINQQAAESFEKEKSLLERTILDQELRKKAIAALAVSYENFVSNLKELYNSEEPINDKQS